MKVLKSGFMFSGFKVKIPSFNSLRTSNLMFYWAQKSYFHHKMIQNQKLTSFLAKQRMIFFHLRRLVLYKLLFFLQKK